MTEFQTARADFLSHLAGLNRSRHTLDAYGRDVQQFGDFLAGHGLTTLHEITPDHVSAWLAHLAAQGISGTSRNRKFHALNTFFKFLVTTGRLDRSPTLGLAAPTVEQREPRVLTTTEIKALQGVCRDDPRDAAMIEILLQTGLRVSELVALTLDDVTWSEPDTVAHLTVKQAKGQKDRLVPLNSRAEKALKRWLKVRPESEYPHLFLSKRGKKPLYPADVRTMLHKYYAKAGIRGASVHTLRHTFCTHHAAKGTNLVVIQRAAGHASLTTTQRYLHLVDRIMAEQLEENAL
ncbi:MAG: tyrosine-type recombinase/integrase [Anaerolineae bacterium]|nr:tyrosine-type recombinase/integrase [Anaerolineae bacterium]